MGDVTIRLADNDIERARTRANNVGLSSAEEYLRAVLESDLHDETFEVVRRISPPSHLRVGSMEQMRNLALEALSGPPPVPMTPEDFARTRLELIQKSSRREK